MIGIFQGFELTFGSFGQQYTTIDGRRYVTWFDAAVPNLGGLETGVQVEFEPRPAPTELCDRPAVQENLPSARLLRVLTNAEDV